jgi:hypothetical protein
MLWTDVSYLLRDCPQLKLGEVYKDLGLGKKQLWVAIGDVHHVMAGVILTEKHRYPPMKLKPRAGRPLKDDRQDRWNLPERHVLQIHLAASSSYTEHSIGRWIEPAITEIEAFARQLDCTELRLLCRKGWRPYAEKFGRGFERVSFRRDRLTLPQFRRKARRLGPGSHLHGFISPERSGAPL